MDLREALQKEEEIYSNLYLKTEGLDEGIRRWVNLLQSHDILTYESCEGGEGHSYAEPAIRFHGSYADGFKALAIAQEHGLPVKRLNRMWEVVDGEPTGPDWELVFWRKSEEPPVSKQPLHK